MDLRVTYKLESDSNKDNAVTVSYMHLRRVIGHAGKDYVIKYIVSFLYFVRKSLMDKKSYITKSQRVAKCPQTVARNYIELQGITESYRMLKERKC